MQEYIAKAMVLIEALPYIQRFRGAVVVVKFGGSAMEDPAITRGVLRDVVFMEAVGMKPVLVHGGGKAISGRLEQLGIPTRFVGGLRYTCDRSIAVVDEVLHQEVNAALVSGLTEFGGRARPLSGKDLLAARRLTEAGSEDDLGYVGEITGVDAEPIRKLLAEDVVPVITPLGRGDDGSIYNINADTSACRIAEALRARKLVYLSDVPGLLADPADEGSLISSLRLPEIPEGIANGRFQGGMVPKLESARQALAAGVQKVHLIDGRLQHSLLLEMFTDRGVGTEIVH